MPNTRTKYDDKGRVVTRVVTNENGVTTKYDFTYKGNSEKPNRIGKTLDHISHLILQMDDMGRETYRLDEDTNISYKTFYGCVENNLVETLKDEFNTSIPGKYLVDIESNYKSITYGIDENYSITMVKIIPVQPQMSYITFNDEFRNYYIKTIDNAMLKHNFPEVPEGKNISNEEYIFWFTDNKLVYREVRRYSVDSLVTIDSYNIVDETSENSVGFKEETEDGYYDFAVQWSADDTVTTEAKMNFIDKTCPLIPKDSNIISRKYKFNEDTGEIIEKKTVDTEITESVDSKGNFSHTTKFYDSTDKEECYIINRTVDSETGNPIRMLNSATGEINIFDYNDQGLMTKNVTSMKEAPKKMLYKGAKPLSNFPSKSTVTTRKWHYTEDGKLILYSAHNELLCSFTAFEYDDEGREIFQSSFTSVTI